MLSVMVVSRHMYYYIKQLILTEEIISKVCACLLPNTTYQQSPPASTHPLPALTPCQHSPPANTHPLPTLTVGWYMLADVRLDVGADEALSRPSSSTLSHWVDPGILSDIMGRYGQCGTLWDIMSHSKTLCQCWTKRDILTSWDILTLWDICRTL